ncbi:MAG: response regulator transcription factor [Acidobacteria bacterium]|nr:response regulator transcription factor [Acidobacteriota bacterium]
MNDAAHDVADAPQGIRTLIVDDSPEFLNAARQFLERLPSVELVGTAEDGMQALALVASARPDLVLMDITMPRLNGLEATRTIRTEFPGVHVIIITLHDSAELRATSITAGADGFISKSALRDELPGAIAQLFSSRTSSTEEMRP